MQILYNEDKQMYEVYRYKEKISEEALRKRQEEYYEFDASIKAWNSFYLKVYSKINVFNENFDFTKPKEIGHRIVIPAKKDSALFQNYQRFWENEGIPGEPKGYYLSGDCDYKYKDISYQDRHKLLNISLLPVTGGLNDDKGSKGSVNDVFSCYIKRLPQLIDDPHSLPGNYGKLNAYRKKIASCARKAYFELFDKKIENYFYNVSFFGINDAKSDMEKQLFIKTTALLKYILEEEEIVEEELAKCYWELRTEILKEKYGLNINEMEIIPPV